MVHAVVWGWHGVGGGVLLLMVALLCVIGAIWIGGRRPRVQGRGAAVAFFGAVGIIFLLTSVDAFWAGFHARTVEITVLRLNETPQYKSRSFDVESTDDRQFDISREIYNSLEEGDRVQCRVTDTLFTGPSIISCTRLQAPARPHVTSQPALTPLIQLPP